MFDISPYTFIFILINIEQSIFDIIIKFNVDIIEINNDLEVFLQISKTDVGFGNNRGRRPRLLQNPNEVFDICKNTSKSLFISILL